MQPDPDVFLRGIRRELLALTTEMGSRLSVKQSLTLQRAAEGLAQLVFRQERLPRVLGEVHEKQLRLLHETAARMRDLGVSVPTFDFTRSEPGEVRGYEAMAATQAACLATLSRLDQGNPQTRRTLETLARASSELESEVRARSLAEIKSITTAEDAAAPTMDQLVRSPTAAELTAYLRKRFPELPELKATNVRAHSGVNAKEVIFFDVAGHPDWPQTVVMRRDRHFSTAKTSVAPEYNVLDHLWRCGLPVPRPLLTEYDPSHLHHPFLLMECVPGSAQSATALSSRGPQLGARLATLLARIHNCDLRQVYGGVSTRPLPARQRVLAMVEKYYRVWLEERIEPSLILEAGYAWLRSHVDQVDHNLVLVHADFDFRNFLVHDGEISAIVDWEVAHPGDPTEDLGYCRPDIEKLMPWTEFLRLYRQQGGPAVSDESIRYFEVWGHVFRLTSASTAWIGYCTGLHRDLIFGSVGFIEYAQSLQVLAEVLRAGDASPAPART